MIIIASRDKRALRLEMAMDQPAMIENDRMLGVYLHLARASTLRRQPMIRDKLLILAGVQAQEMGLEEIAALCRHRILAHNARHLVGQWPTLTAALADEKFRSYLKQLRRRYSAEKTEHMLHSLGIELGREREAYFNDQEYAAALLDTRPEAIAGILAQGPGDAAHGPARPGASLDAAERGRGSAGGSWTFERVFRWLVIWGPFVVALLVVAALSILSCGSFR
jgi:hypothetical protein